MRTAKELSKGKSFSITREFSALERQEIEDRQALRHLHRSSSDALFAYAMWQHARRYREFYTANDVYKYERDFVMSGGFDRDEFLLWSSCD